MSITRNATAGSSSTGRRSTSLEKHQKRSSSGNGASFVNTNHSRTRSASGASPKGYVDYSATQGNGGAGGTGVTLPSPPLTPVASLENLRGKKGEAAKERLDLDATHDMPGKRQKPTSTSMPVSREAPKRVASDRPERHDDDGDETEDGVDTGVDGAVATFSSHPEGVAETVETSSDGGAGAGASDDGVASATNNRDGADLALPSSTLAAVPRSQLSVYTFPHESRTSRREEDRDPLNAADVNGNAEVTTGRASNSHKRSASGVSLSMPPGHEHESTSTPMPVPMSPRLHPLHDPSPQPWDLVHPPPDNNAVMEERLRRLRKESNKSSPPSVANVVVKDGRKYRIPHSSYYFGPPPDTSAFGTDPIGQIGVHHPREIVRIERDYSGGELPQFSPAYPLELEGRITPKQFLETINAINEMLVEAHSLRWSFLDNTLAVLTLYISRLLLASHYTRKMRYLKELIDRLNKELYNPTGLNILWPKDVAFMFLEIEYY